MNPLCVEIWMWDSIETSDKTLRVTELLAPTVPRENYERTDEHVKICEIITVKQDV